MITYRVSELVKPRDYVSLAMIVAAEEGRAVHKLLAEKYGAIRGRHIEQTIVCWLSKNISKTAPILGWIWGHPDMWWVEGTTLHVVDWKTISPKAKIGTESWWWNQVSLYALLILINNPSLVITSIYLELWVYQRKDTGADTVTSYTPFLHVTTPGHLKKKMAAWLRGAVNESYCLTPASSGQVVHA